MPSLDELHELLQNWGRWSRAHDARLGIPPPPAFADYRASAAWEPGWGDVGTPDALAMPVDERAAEACEAVLVRLAARHRHLLRRHYFVRASQPELERQAALRAFADAWAAKSP